MSDTSVQVLPGQPPPGGPGIPPPRRVERFGGVWKILKTVSSLRLTVVLFVLSLFLVFCGTLGQVDETLYTVLTRYFRTWIAWIPLQVFVRFAQVFFGLPQTVQLSGGFPFPGGGILGGLLLINLVAAHLVRFKISWKRTGILMIHAGLILLLIGELVTWQCAAEGSMTIPVGGSSNFIENFDKVELSFTRSLDDKKDDIVVIPESILRKGGLIQHDELPVDVEVVRYFVNSSLTKDVPSGAENLATEGFGLSALAVEQPGGRGVDAEQKHDTASAYVMLKDKATHKPLGTYLVSVLLNPQSVDINGTPYQLALRLQRSYRRYAFHLLKLDHETYRGTGIARNYASLVRVTNPARGEDREVLIWMNHPLYYEGETYYQSQVLAGGAMTGLQVVRNPGWVLPYISCTLVSLGMLVHFGLHLLSFFRRRAAV
jgi:hypothetical protein